MSQRAWPAVALVALALAVAALVRTHAAAAPWHYFAHDQQVYLAMARAPFSDDPQVHHASGCWRLLPPLLARYLGMPIGGPERGFLVLTFSMFALLPAAAMGWLSSLGASRTSAIACGAVMAIAPPVVGLLAWDVVRVDAVGVLWPFLAATATVRGRGLWMCVGIAAMALTKETALLGGFFALAWAVLRNRRLIAAAVGCVGLALVLAQVPWLLQMGRVWPAPLADDLPHFPPIRYVEIAIVVGSVAAAAVALLRRRPLEAVAA